MVNKHVILETFLKLESYDKISIISDILRLSTSLELEFYSSIIENILHYHKLSLNTLQDELNHENNFKSLINSDGTESNIRSKLISTLSLLKMSNNSGAAQIFNILQQNHSKFKEQALSNPTTYEEIMLIHQLANDHPAFRFDHCQEIFDYLTQIRSMPIQRDYFNLDNTYGTINDIMVLSLDINDKDQYVYTIEVKWDHSKCCIKRTLEDIYHFYKNICEMFPCELRNGEICKLYLSFSHDNVELSVNLMSTFFKEFLNSPQVISHCDYVRQFFKPRPTDRPICNCPTCKDDYSKYHWGGHYIFDSITNCTSPITQSDNDEYPQSVDNKTDISGSSTFNYSVNSKYHTDNLPLHLRLSNQTGWDYDSDVSVKLRKRKTRIYHSTGSSPIHTPSEDSEIFAKNDFSKNQTSRFSRQLSMVTENTNVTSSCKDIRTENWLSQSNKTITSGNSQDSIDSTSSSIDNTIEPYDYDTKNLYSGMLDLKSIAQCQISNLHDWLRQKGLHQYYSRIYQMNFEQFYSLTDDILNDLGFGEKESKKLLRLIGQIKQSDIVKIDEGIVNIISGDDSNSTNSSSSFLNSSVEYSSSQQSSDSIIELPHQGHSVIVNNYMYSQWFPNNYVLIVPNYIQRVLTKAPENSYK